MTVDVFDNSGSEVAAATTNASGAYTVTRLQPSSTGYRVCFDAGSATGGGSTTGYLDQCYQDVAWTAFSPVPAAATPVAVSSGVTSSGINPMLVSGGAVSGAVTAASGGAALAQVEVEVFGSNGGGSDGHYRHHRALQSGRVVAWLLHRLLRASGAIGGSSTTGYLSQCYRNVPWQPGEQVPAGAKKINVSAGAATTGIKAALGAAGAITGTIATAGGGIPLANVVVEVASSSGFVIATGVSQSNGTYTVTGLQTSSGDTVCFDARAATGGHSPSGYESQCYKNVPWSGGAVLESGTTPVPVTAGSTSTANAALPAASGISGQVTSAADGSPLSQVSVDVFDTSGNEVAFAPTDTNGHYVIGDLGASATGFVVCFDASLASGGHSSSGYQSQCYKNVPWAGVYMPAPGGATPVTVNSGTTQTINAALGNAGAISGTVKSFDGMSLAGVLVKVFDRSGHQLSQASTVVRRDLPRRRPQSHLQRRRRVLRCDRITGNHRGA